MELRPHHLLCIQKYTGHGYDEAFTAHMTGVVAALCGNVEIALVKGCDHLCGACPNRGASGCASLEKVDVMDAAVLAACGLAYGERGAWAELARLARERVFGTEEFGRICGNCEWFSLCEHTEVRI